MPLIDSLNNYRNSIIEANGFINVAFQQDAAGNYILPQNQRNFITDSSFLKTFIVWETFLESVCIKYLLGEPSILGNVITRHALPLNDLKTIRNAAAHLSSTTSTQLDSLAGRLLGSPQTNITVSQLIFSIDPASITGDTIFTTYLTKLDIVAEGITNG